MKLVIQIPCLNEAETLPAVLDALPERIDGVDEIAVLVIDDGSEDATSEVARGRGAYVLRHRRRRGLAAAFRSGLRGALSLGADLIVNTDGDGQYLGGELPALVSPLLDGRADLVLGDRQTATLAHFSPIKRLLQRQGTRVVRFLAQVEVPDATTGFRAMTRATATRLSVHADYTYTLETLVQAGRMGLSVVSVPITAQAVERPSRLFRSIPEYLLRAGTTALRATVMHRPLRVFGGVAVLLGLPGLALGLRAVAYHLMGVNGHLQSLVLAALLLVLAAMFGLGALLADLLRANRLATERLHARLWEVEGARGALGPELLPPLHHQRGA